MISTSDNFDFNLKTISVLTFYLKHFVLFVFISFFLQLAENGTSILEAI